MPEYSPSEIAKLIGKPRKSVEVYVARKKLIKNDNKKIDTSNPINALFLEKYKKIENSNIDSNSNTKVAEKKNEVPKNQSQPKQKPNPQNSASALIQLEYMSKKLTAQKLQQEIEIKSVELRKKKGELVDLESTLNIVKHYSISMKKNIAEEIQSMIQELGARYDIAPEKIGGYKLKVNEIINQCNDNSINDLKNKFNN